MITCLLSTISHSILFYSTGLLCRIIACLHQISVSCLLSFCAFTAYSEEEVIGKNCCFFQAPAGQVSKDNIRCFTSQDAVAYLAKSSMTDKGCQTGIVNYKINGDPFVNLVTIISVPGGIAGNFDEKRDIVYQIGFQVNLLEQPDAILEKTRDYSYVVDYASLWY